MAPFDMTIQVKHPYTKFSDAHAHIGLSPLRLPAFSANCVPFRWMLRENAMVIAEEYDLDYRPALEEQADKRIGFNTIWVQDRHNQLALTDTFFSAVQPETSLCFFYAKQTPLSEDHRRVLLGAGAVTHVGDATEYSYEGSGDLRSMLWERPVHHSIREGFVDGFLFPYQALYKRTLEDAEIDPIPYLAFVPDEHFEQFSYTSEHVSHDVAISSLVTCLRSLEQFAGDSPGNWDAAIDWVNGQLGQLWQLRGPFPGIGAALTAFGVERGHLLAFTLADQLEEEGDPWELMDRVFQDPQAFSVNSHIGKALSTKWANLPDERMQLLRLIARFDLTLEQATRFYQPADREKARVSVSDRDLIENPYLLFELDRFSEVPITVASVDRGVFP